MTAATEIKFHDKESWHLESIPGIAPSFVAGRVLSELADKDDRIVVMNADLGHANRTIEFAEKHPERYFNMGIAEHNMVSSAAGLASTGFIPYVGTFASFLGILCCEQIRTDLAYPNMPVRLLSHHAGISLGYYGTSHHATEDIGIMRSMANIKIVCPADSYRLRAGSKADGRPRRADLLQAERGRLSGCLQERRRLAVWRYTDPPRGKGCSRTCERDDGPPCITGSEEAR